jgi:hypothetical protein
MILFTLIKDNSFRGFCVAADEVFKHFVYLFKKTPTDAAELDIV